MGLGVVAVAAVLLAGAGAGLPPRSPDSRSRDGGPAAGAAEGAREAGPAGGLRRAKRGFTYPGTLWCGAGNIAESYEQLGEHRETDQCCRDHDHCQHLIHPFTYKYGHRNLRWHTISHCDCDRRLKDCLGAVNNTASRVVGQAFFNIIQVPCFELVSRETCVESYLYVWCKNYSRTSVAVLKEPVMFDYGGERIDAPATRRPKPASSSTSTPTPTRPLGTSPAPPRWKTPQASPPRPRKGHGKEGRGRKGKGAKKQRQKKGRWAKPDSPVAHQRPPAEGAPLKELAVQGLAKGGAQASEGSPKTGQGDSFNAILSDEPGRAGTPESLQTVLQKGRPTAGPSGGRKKRRRKRRRKAQTEEEASPRHQKHSTPGRDSEEGMWAA